MSALDSTSTLDEIKAAYADNASYAEDDSVTKALAFCTACRLLLLKLPKHTARGGTGAYEVDMDIAQLKAELDAAVAWAAQKSDSGVIKHVSFENFR